MGTSRCSSDRSTAGSIAFFEVFAAAAIAMSSASFTDNPSPPLFWFPSYPVPEPPTPRPPPPKPPRFAARASAPPAVDRAAGASPRSGGGSSIRARRGDTTVTPDAKCLKTGIWSVSGDTPETDCRGPNRCLVLYSIVADCRGPNRCLVLYSIVALRRRL